MLLGVLVALSAAAPGDAKPQATASGNAASADDLYRAGVDERRAGRHDEAVTLLARAATLEPKNADIRLQLGLALMALKRLDAAELELQHALRLAPEYVDVEVALARVDLWRNRRALAEVRASRLLRDNPSHKDVVELTAALGENPASQTAPIARQELPLLRLTRFDGSFGYAHLSGGRSPWREIALAAAFATSGGDTIVAGVEHASRFERADTYLEFRFDTKLTPHFGAYGLIGGAPDANFKPEAAIAAGGWWTMIDGDEWLHVLRLVVDAKYAAFATGDVSSLILGLETELFDGDVLIAARQINLIDETEQYQNGYALQLRVQASETLAIFCGWAQAPDTSEGRTFETRTTYVGAQLALSQELLATATYAHDELEGLYDRSSGALAFSYRFEP